VDRADIAIEVLSAVILLASGQVISGRMFASLNEALEPRI
jgi:hypothetical protein